ncbi:MAG: hypothetical protein IPN73_19580 [Saprospiraceae bacterium]|nr:hypothetical protein [Saprospiraceae bacterium]MBK8852336.1 hypothetical protein [Saprospiraceae bacterium]
MKTKIIKKPLTGPLEEMPVYRHGLRPEEKNRADEQLMVAVRKKRSQMSEAQMQYASLMQLRYLIEDYIKADQYDERWSFANVLRAYIKLKYKSNKAFAQDLCLDETELSSVLNKRRSPSDKTIIRLELHSNSIIPATSWYRLVQLEKAHFFFDNIKNIQAEEKNVKNRMVSHF